MALVVQKYGGSSVADDEKIRNVARRVAASAPGRELVVVVSAMGKTTDGLVALAHQVSPSPEPGEIAVVAGFQGLSDEDEITTLGRGGTDLTAVALAAAL